MTPYTIASIRARCPAALKITETSNLPSDTGLLTEAERQQLHDRAVQARAAASDAIKRYATLVAESQRRLNVTAQRLLQTDTRETIRASLERYALFMKALDTPPERMLRLVKETLKEHVPHPERAKETHALLENAVSWCIEAYYCSSPAA